MADAAAPPGLVRGLSGACLAAAIRSMQEHPARDWTVEQRVKEAAEGSVLFDRSSRTMRMAAMEYRWPGTRRSPSPGTGFGGIVAWSPTSQNGPAIAAISSAFVGNLVTAGTATDRAL